MRIEVRGQAHSRFRVYGDGRYVAAYTVGEFRPYVYPLCTPEGFPVTEESPPDHPHHQSLWLGQDLVDGMNFWLNSAGCGRIVGDEPTVTTKPMPDDEGAVFYHQLTWQAPDGRAVLQERRATAITPTTDCLIVDVRSIRTPAAGPVTFGATKEAGLGVRVLDMLDEEDGGILRNSQGYQGEAATFDSEANWVDYSGLLGDRWVGVALFAHPDNPRHPWFTRSYGIILLNHHRFAGQVLTPGEELTLQWRAVVHDGPPAAKVPALYDRYIRACRAGSLTDPLTCPTIDTTQSRQPGPIEVASAQAK